MRYRHLVPGIAGAALLCAALAGCGSRLLTAQSRPAVQAAAASATGCAAVNQATAVTLHRSMRLVVPTSGGALTTTQRRPALVRALFSDFCDVVSHRAPVRKLLHCPVAFGLDYTGTFYAGTRVLATFVYGASGCQAVSITAAGTTESATVFGTAAAAAPHLETDLAAVLGQPESAVYQPPASVNPGGPMKSATR